MADPKEQPMPDPYTLSLFDIRACQTCWAMVHKDHQQRHLDWHREQGHEVVILDQPSWTAAG
jgi:hypothetical protein